MYVGYSIPAGFILLFLWALVAFVRGRPPGRFFWHLLAAVQVVLAVQVAIGGVLFASGARPVSNGPRWLHYVYGGLFPLAVLVAAHAFARAPVGVQWVAGFLRHVRRRPDDLPWLAFGLAALINFGLTFRALQTGLGID